MAFEFFLIECQKMYNILEEEGVLMEQGSKIRFLFKQVEHSELQKSIEVLKSHMATNPSEKVSYTTAGNHLITDVS